MTFVNMGALVTLPGAQEQVIALLTRTNADLAEAGCLLYEVGTDEKVPDTVFVAEVWVSAQAHERSLDLESVQTAIAQAMPLLSGEMRGDRFHVRGSPLRPS